MGKPDYNSEIHHRRSSSIAIMLVARHVTDSLQTRSRARAGNVIHIRIFSSSSDVEDAVGRFTHTQAFVLGASLSASADFLFSTSVNDLSLSIEADTTVQTRIEAINLGHTPQMDPDALNLLKRDPAGFINRYGTHFIGGFIYGGYFTGAINLRSHSVADRAHLTADLQKSINLWHAGASTTSQFKSCLGEKKQGAAGFLVVGKTNGSERPCLQSFCGNLW